MLSRLIQEVKNAELNIDEMKALVGDTCNVIADRDLTINDVFDTIRKGCIIVLLLKGKTKHGHYIGITIDNRKECINFYDPYGLHIEILSTLAGGEITNFLFELQTALPRYKLDINMRPMQKMNDKTSTCGRFCTIRVMCKNLSNNQFNDMLDNPIMLKSADDIVTLMTLYRDLLKL